LARPVVILDFGAQYAQLIARRVREIGFFSVIVPFDTPLTEIRRMGAAAVILSGGPRSVYDDGSPLPAEDLMASGLPILGICYGMQAIAHLLGGDLVPAHTREYGRVTLATRAPSVLFGDEEGERTVWMSHGDTVQSPPPGFRTTASTGSVPVAAMEDPARGLFGVQFHPEVVHTEGGREILRRFLIHGAHLSQDWRMGDAIAEGIAAIRRTVGDEKAMVALSGGVDSSVAAALVERAIGKNLIAVFVDHGLMRQGEGDVVEEAFTRTFPSTFRRIDASDRFIAALAGVVDPERKRRIIGELFIEVFREVARGIGDVPYLVQGTLYPDVIESGTSQAAVIKSHHNVGGLPAELGFKLVEPLRDLFKDEVRQMGRELGLPAALVDRQPFPGPGLAIRIVGEVTRDRLDLLRAADAIVREEVETEALAQGLWQYFAVLPGARSVGVMGDGRTYDEAIVVRAVTSEDGMTADWARLPHGLLDRLASRLVGEVRGVNRVLYDITSKPPGTIEWE